MLLGSTCGGADGNISSAGELSVHAIADGGGRRTAMRAPRAPRARTSTTPRCSTARAEIRRLIASLRRVRRSTPHGSVGKGRCRRRPFRADGQEDRCAMATLRPSVLGEDGRSPVNVDRADQAGSEVRGVREQEPATLAEVTVVERLLCSSSSPARSLDLAGTWRAAKTLRLVRPLWRPSAWAHRGSGLDRCRP